MKIFSFKRFLSSRPITADDLLHAQHCSFFLGKDCDCGAVSERIHGM
jgi:hypothetical protein